MYTKNYEEGELHLRRFMVDEKYQGKGYGKETLELLKEIALKSERLLAQHPDAEIWCVRVGPRVLHRMGGRPLRG